MHDPMTLAFEIKRPWRDRPSRSWPKGYRPTWVQIWHVDPERDGSDDSCGWSFPKVDTEAQWFRKLAGDIAFLGREDPGELEAQRRREGRPAWWILWLNRASYWHRGRPLSQRQIHGELFAMSFPGNREDGPLVSDEPQRIAWIFARCYLAIVRPWYRHPRWHFWHWRIQVVPVVLLKRWLFSRCCVCGGRFAYGESPTSAAWRGGGPRWFRGEAHVRHGNCSAEARVRDPLPGASS